MKCKFLFSFLFFSVFYSLSVSPSFAYEAWCTSYCVGGSKSCDGSSCSAACCAADPNATMCIAEVPSGGSWGNCGGCSGTQCCWKTCGGGPGTPTPPTIRGQVTVEGVTGGTSNFAGPNGIAPEQNTPTQAYCDGNIDRCCDPNGRFCRGACVRCNDSMNVMGVCSGGLTSYGISGTNTLTVKMDNMDNAVDPNWISLVNFQGNLQCGSLANDQGTCGEGTCVGVSRGPFFSFGTGSNATPIPPNTSHTFTVTPTAGYYCKTITLSGGATATANGCTLSATLGQGSHTLAIVLTTTPPNYAPTINSVSVSPVDICGAVNRTVVFTTAVEDTGAIAGNLIVNSSFENGGTTLPTGWIWSGGATGRSIGTVTSEDKLYGSYSYKETPVGGDWFSAVANETNCSGIRGQTYTLGGMVKSTGNITGSFKISYLRTNGNWDYNYYYTPLITGSNAWQKSFGAFTVPADCQTMRPEAISWGNNGSAYFDGLVLKAGTIFYQYSDVQRIFFGLSPSGCPASGSGEAGCNNFERNLANHYGGFFAFDGGWGGVANNNTRSSCSGSTGAATCPWSYFGLGAIDADGYYATNPVNLTNAAGTATLLGLRPRLTGSIVYIDWKVRLENTFPVGNYIFRGMALDYAGNWQTGGSGARWDNLGSWTINSCTGTISGGYYKDDNGNGRRDAGENTTINNAATSVTYGTITCDHSITPSTYSCTATVSTAVYSVSAVPNPPQAVQLTGCGATGGCSIQMVSGNTNLDLMFHDNPSGWLQAKNGDVYARGSGAIGVSLTVPLVTTGSYDRWFLDADSATSRGGLVLSASAINANDGAGSDRASERNWKIPNYTTPPTWPANFSFAAPAGAAPYTNFNALSSGGIYARIGVLTIPSGNNNYNFALPATIYIDGNLTINGDISKQGNGGLIFVVNGNVTINNIDSGNAKIDALIIANGTLTTANCAPPNYCNKELKIKGGVYASNFAFNRALTDNRKPAIYVEFDPTYLVFPPPALSSSRYDWQEIAP